jgi:hypothetical protein
MKNTLLTMYLLIVILVAASPAIHAKPLEYPFPEMALDRDNPRPDAPPFYTEPYASTYDERVRIALEWTAEHNGGWDGAVARVLLGRDAAMPDNVVASFSDRLAGREDCADFTAIRIVTTLFIHGKTPFLSNEHSARLKKTLLDFKYWFDEPGPDTMITWTENHQILFHANEFLAGQLFPDDIFTNNGQTGRWHMEHARPKILKWMERRARWGFSEWDSNVYYGEDLGAVLNLAQFADDPEIAQAAAIVADIMFFDMIADQFHGVYGTSHGRTYAKDVLTGRDDDTHDILAMITGIGSFNGCAGMDAVPLCASGRYRPAQVLLDIATDNPAEYVNLERHGIPLEKVPDYGLSFHDMEDLAPLLGMGIYSQPEILDLFIEAADKYGFWNQPFLADIGDLHKMLPRNGTAGAMRKNMQIESDRTLLGEVNKITYRTHDYMLSSAQDYRPGTRGNQQHVWQATLSPEAVVFTTNPGSLKLHDRTPCYWGGQNRFPRVGQYKNLAFILYDIDMTKALGERKVFDFTHAFFPKWAFDEVREQDHWIMGRRKQGYMALYSALPYEWKDPDSPWVHDAIAKGTKQIWIAFLGSESEYGSFDAFARAVTTAPLNVDLDTLAVSFDAPHIGAASFAWTGPLAVAGEQIPLNGYKRVQNPYCTAQFDTGFYVIEFNGKRITLDYPHLARTQEEVME